MDIIQPKVTPYTKGMAAVYFVAAELSTRGYIVTTTARNAPSVDVMVTTSDMKKTFNIQVKTSTQPYFLLRKDAKKMSSPNFLYIFVKFNHDPEQKPDFYIVKSSVVAQNIEEYGSKGDMWYSFSPTEKDKDKWELLK